MVSLRHRALVGILVGVAAFGGLGSEAKSAPAASPGAALSAYLDKVNQAREPYAKAAPAVESALNHVSNTPDATWTTAAQKVTVSSHAAAHLAAALVTITPPPGLRQANGQF